MNSNQNNMTGAPILIAKTPRWLVLSKPPGWLSIPGRISSAGVESSPALSSEASAGSLSARDPSIPPVLLEWAEREHGPLWVVHRLDRETSGVILFARTEQDHSAANEWFRLRKTKKIYHCLAGGTTAASAGLDESGVISSVASGARSPAAPPRSRPPAPVLRVQEPIEGKPSLSQIEIRETYEEGFLARVTPRTGRRHQIRIHMAFVGFPIWGDSQYGGVHDIQLRISIVTVERVALHASSLELPTGEKFEAPFTEDFAAWLDRLRKEGHRV